ncbi:unnamed protein product [Jaminaea pallidilutea]
MAVSIAVNWTPPASSPLFEDDSGVVGGSPRDSQVTSAPLSSSAEGLLSSQQGVSNGADSQRSLSPRSYAAAAAAPASGDSTSASLSSAGNNHQISPGPHSGQPHDQVVERQHADTQSSPAVPSAEAAQPTAFAHPQGFAQASPQSQQHFQSYGGGSQPFYPAQQSQQLPMHGAGFGPAYNMAFAPPSMPQHQYAWSQYQQQMASAQRQQPNSSQVQTDFSSTLQRPSALTYNDSFQQQPPHQHPGSTHPALNRGNLPPGAMPASSMPVTAHATPASSNGFHPYRRQGRPSDAGTTPAPASHLPSTPSSANAVGSHLSTSNDAERVDEHASLSTETAAPATSMTRQSSADSGSFRTPEPPSRSESTRSASSGITTPSSAVGSQNAPAMTPANDKVSAPHSRSESVSSQSSAFSSGISDVASTIGRSSSAAAKKPSPLSRTARPDGDEDEQNVSISGRKDGREETDAAAPSAGKKPSKSLSGKLRKALSLSTMNEMQQAEGRSVSAGNPPRPTAAPTGRALAPSAGRSTDQYASVRTNPERPPSPPRWPSAQSSSDFMPHGAGSSAASISSRRSTRPPISGSTDGSGKRSIFKSKFNSSTDNISISSTVSSASVMLRKVGNFGKLARRHSLMGLTNMFNKDKDGKDLDGAGGLHGDDFGALPVPADEAALGNAGVKPKKSKKGKGDPAAASVSHATVELDPNGDGGMTPAAHYVRQHQIQMRQQAEADAARERQEAERKKQETEAANAAAAAKAKGKTTDDVVESRQKMIEKEKERLKSKRGWKNRLKVGGGSSSNISSAHNDRTQVSNGLETVPYGDDDADGSSSDFAPRGIYDNSYGGPGSMTASRSEPNLSQYGGAHGYTDDLEPPPRMPALGGAGGEESSGEDGETDSLRHWGEGIERSRASAARVTHTKGILKKSASSSQLDQMGGPGGFVRPFAGRVRANSYDSPQAAATSNNAPLLTAMPGTSEGVDRMDGVNRSPSPRPSGEDGSRQAQQPGSSQVYGHHSNSSMPTLSLMTEKPGTPSGGLPRVSLQKKRIVFTDSHIYHSTWPAHVYDRRGDLATCNRLTPELAAQIKEELNSFKMEEMEVAPSSRIFTHFFI